MLLRRGFHEYKFAGVTNKNQVTTRQQHLPIAVTSALPLPLTRIHVEASENAFIQTIDITLIKNRAVKLVLHVDVFPDGAGTQRGATTRDLDKRRPLAVSGGNEDV